MGRMTGLWSASLGMAKYKIHRTGNSAEAIFPLYRQKAKEVQTQDPFGTLPGKMLLPLCLYLNPDALTTAACPTCWTNSQPLLHGGFLPLMKVLWEQLLTLQDYSSLNVTGTSCCLTKLSKAAEPELPITGLIVWDCCIHLALLSGSLSQAWGNKLKSTQLAPFWRWLSHQNSGTGFVSPLFLMPGWIWYLVQSTPNSD